MKNLLIYCLNKNFYRYTNLSKLIDNSLIDRSPQLFSFLVLVGGMSSILNEPDGIMISGGISTQKYNDQQTLIFNDYTMLIEHLLDLQWF